MSNNSTDKKVQSKKTNVNLAKILRRPIVRLAILILVVILVVVLVKSFAGKKVENNDGLIGYQKLVNVTDNKYTFIDLDGKVKTYDGYTSMDDFYYDVTCVARLNTDTNVTEMALINKNNKKIVEFGTYDNIIQIVGGKYYKVSKEGKYGVIDKNGKKVIELDYEYISITTVQEASEVVFECQKDGKYYFVNEAGKTLAETDNALHSISYANKFNSEYDTIIYISINGEKKYYDLVTGEELFKDIENPSVSYNIVKTESKVSFYDKNSKLKTEIDTSSDYAVDTRVYFKKYVLVEQRNITSGTREYKYTVYDSDFKQFIDSKEKINLIQDKDKNVYFIINEDDGVKIIDENKKEVKVDGYEFNGNNISNLQYIVLNKINDETQFEVYTFKGKKVIDAINEYTQKGCGLLIGKYNEEGQLLRTLLLGNGKEISLSDQDNVLSNDYYVTIEDASAQTVTVVDFDGKTIVDKASGTKVFYTEKYIGVQEGNNIKIYDVSSGKMTFSYDVQNFINRDEIVNYVELTNGYFGFDGKTILEKDA